jgi:hypothetical protein
MQDPAKHDPVHQLGAGYIDIFTTDGVFVERFATRGRLNAPWGMVLTPANFGPLGGDFWIGNFGDGMINAFDTMGNAKGHPTDSKGNPLQVDGLWALVFGNGTNKAATTSLYFTAGPNKETEGIFGKFTFPSKKTKSSGGGGWHYTAEGGPLDQNPFPELVTKRWVYEQYFRWHRTNSTNWQSRVLAEFP